MSRSVCISKKLKALYDEDPTIFDRCSVEEILQMIHTKFIPIDEPDDIFYKDELQEDPAELARYGYKGGRIYE